MGECRLEGTNLAGLETATTSGGITMRLLPGPPKALEGAQAHCLSCGARPWERCVEPCSCENGEEGHTKNLSEMHAGRAQLQRLLGFFEVLGSGALLASLVMHLLSIDEATIIFGSGRVVTAEFPTSSIWLRAMWIGAFGLGTLFAWMIAEGLIGFFASAKRELVGPRPDAKTSSGHQ